MDMRGFEEREVSWFAKWIIGEVGVVDERSGSERVGEMGERGCRWNLMIGECWRRQMIIVGERDGRRGTWNGDSGESCVVWRKGWLA